MKHQLEYLFSEDGCKFYRCSRPFCANGIRPMCEHHDLDEECNSPQMELPFPLTDAD